ncbi:MAG: dihydrofolate reductase family protein [Anaerolineae bacterium]
MRRIIFLMHVSLDGFVAGPNGEMDWIKYDTEVEKYSHDLHSATDAAIYGRVTYDMMQSYWPTVLTNPDTDPSGMAHARWYDEATKIVISRTLQSDPSLKRVVLSDNFTEEITRLKQQPGKDMWFLGSPGAAQTFMKLGLIDEYRLNVNPIVLGTGKPLFGELGKQLNLKLIEARHFKCGVAGLRYEPAG